MFGDDVEGAAAALVVARRTPDDLGYHGARLSASSNHVPMVPVGREHVVVGPQGQARANPR